MFFLLAHTQSSSHTNEIFNMINFHCPCIHLPKLIVLPLVAGYSLRYYDAQNNSPTVNLVHSIWPVIFLLHQDYTPNFSSQILDFHTRVQHNVHCSWNGLLGMMVELGVEGCDLCIHVLQVVSQLHRDAIAMF